MTKHAHQKLLDEAMGINTEIARLPLISEEIMLISYNAEAAAARAGDQGRSLHVLTAEIHQLADVVSTRVDHMTGQVMGYTRNMATVSNNYTRQLFFNRARTQIEEEQGAEAASLQEINQSIDRLAVANHDLFAAVPAFLRVLEQDVEEIQHRIRLGEIVSTNVSIEVASMMTKGQEAKVFMLLAEKLLQACKEMRNIILLCRKRLETIHLTLRTIEA